MNKELTGKRIIKNVSISILAQIISLLVAFILNLIVPKFISEYQYAYWQIFMLYANYTGLLHLGLLDGFVLRYSQYEYENLDKSLLRSQFYLLMFADLLFAAIVIVWGIFNLEADYMIIAVFVSIAIVLKNAIQYTTYILQITNRIKEYAFTSIIQKIVYGLGVMVVLLFDGKYFYWICICEIIGEVVAFAWAARRSKECYIGKLVPIEKALKEAKTNVSVGVLLLISNSSAMMLIGITKMIVQWKWDELTFSKVAFSFSVTSLFLTFVSAISVVLFPTLKRMKEENLPLIYSKIRSVLSPLLLLVLTLYFPGAWILSKWLPRYNESVVYLGVLLPIIIYRTRVSLLSNNYLKAYRKEKMLLVINAISVSIAITGGVLIEYIFHDIDILLMFTVVTQMGMSIYAEHMVSRITGLKFINENIIECIMTVVFILCARYLNLLHGFLIYLVIVLIYLFINRHVLILNIKKFINR